MKTKRKNPIKIRFQTVRRRRRQVRQRRLIEPIAPTRHARSSKIKQEESRITNQDNKIAWFYYPRTPTRPGCIHRRVCTDQAVFIKLHITAQSGPVILIILRARVCVCMYARECVGWLEPTQYTATLKGKCWNVHHKDRAIDAGYPTFYLASLLAVALLLLCCCFAKNPLLTLDQLHWPRHGGRQKRPQAGTCCFQQPRGRIAWCVWPVDPLGGSPWEVRRLCVRLFFLLVFFVCAFSAWIVVFISIFCFFFTLIFLSLFCFHFFFSFFGIIIIFWFYFFHVFVTIFLIHCVCLFCFFLSWFLFLFFAFVFGSIYILIYFSILYQYLFLFLFTLFFLARVLFHFFSILSAFYLFFNVVSISIFCCYFVLFRFPFCCCCYFISSFFSFYFFVFSFFIFTVLFVSTFVSNFKFYFIFFLFCSCFIYMLGI